MLRLVIDMKATERVARRYLMEELFEYEHNSKVFLFFRKHQRGRRYDLPNNARKKLLAIR